MKIDIGFLKNFGETTWQRCCVCGETPAKIDPRTKLPVCIECCFLSPRQIKEERIYFDDEFDDDPDFCFDSPEDY